jgi:drug/metabolite transporter (DMT)-like permease
MSDTYETLEPDDATTTIHTTTMSQGHAKCNGAIGLIFMALSALSFSIMSFLVHLLTTTLAVPSFELVAFRSALGIVLCLGWVHYNNQQVIPTSVLDRKLLAARAVIGTCGMLGNWFLLSQLPLGDATVIIFTAPMFTLLLARIILKEKLSWKMMFLVAVSVVGVVLVARPSFLGFPEDVAPPYAEMARSLVVLIGLLAAIASAATNILVRKLLNVPAMVTVLWLMVVSFSISFPIALFHSKSKWPPSLGHWVLVLCMAGLGFSGQGFKTQGLKWEQAGIGSMMRNLDLVLAFGFQVTLLGEQFKVLSVVGASLTLSTSIAMGYLKVQEKRRKTLGDGEDDGGGGGGGGIEVEGMKGTELVVPGNRNRSGSSKSGLTASLYEEEGGEATGIEVAVEAEVM